MMLDPNYCNARAAFAGQRGRRTASRLLVFRSQRLMKKKPIIPHLMRASCAFRSTRRGLLSHVSSALAVLLIFTFSGARSPALAQKRFTERYPTRKNVRLHLTNRSGTITVVAWDKNEIKLSVEMESPSARVTPEVNGDGVLIDVVRDNRGRPDVGDVNFHIWVPVNTMVDLETKRGNITVRGVEGALMRAHVTSEGDIELTDIRSSAVVAENTVGNIVFDAELLRGGTYELRSTQGDISIRITANSGFRLMGLGRDINLGPFGGMGDFRFFGENRKVVGHVGEGAATLNVNNQRGTILFMRR